MKLSFRPVDAHPAQVTLKEGGISLHKAILRVLIVTSGAIVLFLALLDAYLIQSYQESIRTEWKDTLARHVNEARDDLNEISSDLYDIYYYDSNYKKLSSMNGIEAYPYAYELEDRLKTQLLLKRRATGYVMYFDDLREKRYHFNTADFTNAEVEELKQITAKLSSMSNLIRSWYYPMVNGKIFAISIYRNNGVSLGEIYCLENIRTELEADLETVRGRVFFENNGEVLGSQETEETCRSFLGHHDEICKGMYVCKKQAAGTGLTFYLTVPMNLWTYLNAQQVVILIITVLVILFSVLFYFRANRELFRPLDSLTAEMRRIGGGDWSAGIQTQSRFLEIQQVIGTTDRMIEEIEAQRLLTYEKTIEEQKARLQYLSLQLNPHFYLNGLKTLNFLAMNGENERIQEIIIRFSVYLRYLLQREQEMVPLESEIRFTESYISLYREMTDREIQVEWRTAENVKSCMVPRLCIQTFVENSFKYAKVGSADKPLKLRVSASRFTMENGEFLEIMVRDNGEGFAEEILEVLNEEPAEESLSVGVNNLKRRCAILYTKPVEYAFYNDEGAVSDIFYPVLVS